MDAQYKIIGGDGREYGPVSLDELKSWIRDGRVAGTTQIWRDDLATWAPASSYEEIATEFGGDGGVGSESVTPAVPVAEELQPVGFWARLAAYIVDWLFVFLIFYVVWAGVAALTGWHIPKLNLTEADLQDVESFMRALSNYLEATKEYEVAILVNWLVGVLLRMIYEVWLNGSYGATLGKMAIGARIVCVDGSPIGYGRAFLRWLAERVSEFFCYLGYVFIAFRSDKRALHDLMVGTKVVYKR